MTAMDLNQRINDFEFLLQSFNFIQHGIIKLESEKAAKSFLTTFLLSECVSGINYTDKQLIKTYRKVKKMVKKGKEISSEILPIVVNKYHYQKELKDVLYVWESNFCYYKKTG